jgi:hypothetical protein
MDSNFRSLRVMAKFLGNGNRDGGDGDGVRSISTTRGRPLRGESFLTASTRGGVHSRVATPRDLAGWRLKGRNRRCRQRPYTAASPSRRPRLSRRSIRRRAAMRSTAVSSIVLPLGPPVRRRKSARGETAEFGQLSDQGSQPPSHRPPVALNGSPARELPERDGRVGGGNRIRTLGPRTKRALRGRETTRETRNYKFGFPTRASLRFVLLGKPFHRADGPCGLDGLRPPLCFQFGRLLAVILVKSLVRERLLEPVKELGG